MKIKHSKFKNTGILFELLVRQIASDTVSGKDSAAINLVKKYFNKTELNKEHKLYQALINTKALVTLFMLITVLNRNLLSLSLVVFD